jgi:hypothetical protein
MRIGLLFRGTMLDCGLCDTWRREYGGLSVQQWLKTRCGSLRAAHGFGFVEY